MLCDQAQEHLNARIDGELPVAAAAALEAHVANCASCRAVAETLAAIDADLRQAYAPQRASAAQLAERVIAQLSPAATPAPAVLAPGGSTRRSAWGQSALAMAAGFLLAVLIFRPWTPRGTDPLPAPQAEPFARLAVASGPVEIQPAAAFDMRAFLCPQDGPIERNSIVRTGPDARAEIALADGNSLRLDCNTEVTLLGPELVKVTQGRLFGVCPPGHKGMEILSAGCKAVTQDAAQVAVECQPNQARYTVCEGNISVQAGPKSVDVGAGRQVKFVAGELSPAPEQCDDLLETAWVNNVLAMRGAQDPEFAERVNRLLASIGAAKLSLLYEDELRRLGDAGVPPLLAYLEATRETPHAGPRATAARIVADVAESRWIADLIALLTDTSGDVRLHAAHGLERLTGRNQGCDGQTWQSGPWSLCAEPYQKWLAWWAANRDRYPSARQEIPAPNSAPF